MRIYGCDGTLLGIRGRSYTNFGAYLSMAAAMIPTEPAPLAWTLFEEVGDGAALPLARLGVLRVLEQSVLEALVRDALWRAQHAYLTRRERKARS